jgi:hypothetical protein
VVDDAEPAVQRVILVRHAHTEWSPPTLTLALPKTGLARASQVVGDLYVAEISVPPSVYHETALR